MLIAGRLAGVTFKGKTWGISSTDSASLGRPGEHPVTPTPDRCVRGLRLYYGDGKRLAELCSAMARAAGTHVSACQAPVLLQRDSRMRLFVTLG